MASRTVDPASPGREESTEITVERCREIVDWSLSWESVRPATLLQRYLELVQAALQSGRSIVNKAWHLTFLQLESD